MGDIKICVIGAGRWGNNHIRTLFELGAGAVVIKDVPDFLLLLGNPAQIVGWVDKKRSRLEFYKNGLSQCGQFQFDGKIVSILEDS